MPPVMIERTGEGEEGRRPERPVHEPADDGAQRRAKAEGRGLEHGLAGRLELIGQQPVDDHDPRGDEGAEAQSPVTSAWR